MANFNDGTGEIKEEKAPVGGGLTKRSSSNLQRIFDDNISVQNIKSFLNSCGGKAKHSDIVTYFRRPLTDSSLKGRNRAEFKDILLKLTSFKTEDGERYIVLRSPCQTRSISSPEQRRRQIQNERLGSDSTTSSQSSLSTCDSGIALDTQSLASNVAARAREMGKSTDSLEGDDDLMGYIYDDEGLDDHNTIGQNEFTQEEKEWMMFASICDCQQLASMMDRNPELSGKRDFVTGYTALHWGAKLGRRDLVRLIADSGADINARTHGGQTALHLAAMQGHDVIIKMLVNDYGADINARDFAGKKPKDLVKETVAADLQRKLGRSLILDPNSIHLVSGVIRRSKDDHFIRAVEASEPDGAFTPETRRRLRTMSFLKKKKKWPPEKNESDDESEKSKRRPKSSIYLLTPEAARKYKEKSRSMTSFET